MSDKKPELLNRAQVAAKLGVCGDTVTAWYKSGRFQSPVIYTDRSCYWSMKQIEKWFENSTTLTETDQKSHVS